VAQQLAEPAETVVGLVERRVLAQDRPLEREASTGPSACRCRPTRVRPISAPRSRSSAVITASSGGSIGSAKAGTVGFVNAGTVASARIGAVAGAVAAALPGARPRPLPGWRTAMNSGSTPGSRS